MVYRGKRKEYEVFAGRLAKALRRKEYTQIRLAEEAGLSKGMVSLYLAAKSMPESERIAVIAQKLNVSPAWLMGAKVEMDGTAVVSKNEDAKWLMDKISKATEQDAAMMRRLYEAITHERDGSEDS